MARVSCDEMERWLRDPNVVAVDVREEDRDYGFGHIKGSWHCAADTFDARQLQLRKARAFAREADSAALIAAFGCGADGSIGRAEWLVGMLRALELVPEGEVDAILKRFDAIDTDHSGAVSREELQAELDARAARLRSTRGADVATTKRVVQVKHPNGADPGGALSRGWP